MWCASVVAEPEPVGRRWSGDARGASLGWGSASFVGLALEAVAEAPGLVAGVDDVGAVGEAVDDGFRESGVGEDLRPFAEREVCGDDHRRAFVALADDRSEEHTSELQS